MTRKQSGLALAMCVLLFVSLTGGQADEDDRLILMGRRLMIVDPRKAIPYFDKALQNRPASSEARFLRGLARFSSNDHSRALEDFTELARLEPGSAAAHSCLGMAYLLVVPPKFGEAIAQFDEAVRLAPQSSSAYINKAMALYRSVGAQLTPETATAIGWAGELPPPMAATLDQALDVLGKAAALDTNAFAVCFDRGVILKLAFRDVEACRSLSKAIEMNCPYRPADVATLGVDNEQDTVCLVGNEPICMVSGMLSYFQEGFLTCVLPNGDRTRETGDELKYVSSPNDPMAFAYYHRGGGYAKAKLRQYDNALADLDRAVKLNPRVYTFYRLRSLVSVGAGRGAQAGTDTLKAREVAEDLVRRISQVQANGWQMGAILLGKSRPELERVWGTPTGDSSAVDARGRETQTLVYHFRKVEGKDVLAAHVRAGLRDGRISATYEPYHPDVLEHYWVYDVHMEDGRVVCILPRNAD